MRFNDLNEAEFNSAETSAAAIGNVGKAARAAFDRFHSAHKEAKTDVQQDVQQVMAKTETAQKRADAKAKAANAKGSAANAAAEKLKKAIDAGVGMADFLSKEITNQESPVPDKDIVAFDGFDIDELHTAQKSIKEIIGRWNQLPDNYAKFMVDQKVILGLSGKGLKSASVKYTHPSPSDISAIQKQIEGSAGGFGNEDKAMWTAIFTTVSPSRCVALLAGRVSAQTEKNREAKANEKKKADADVNQTTPKGDRVNAQAAAAAKAAPTTESKNLMEADDAEMALKKKYPVGADLIYLYFCQWAVLLDRLETWQQIAIDAEKRPRVKDDAPDDTDDEDLTEALVNLRKFLKRL